MNALHVLLALLLPLPLLSATAATAYAAPQASHDLVVELAPDEALLRGKDRIAFAPELPCRLRLSLAPEAEVLRLEAGEQQLDFDRRGRVLEVELPSDVCGRSGELVLEYAARFDDPLPNDPANMDNPGFGVRGVIGEQGAFLMAGSGWHPRVAGIDERFRVTVKAPAGMYAVTSGALQHLDEEGDVSVTVWDVQRVVEALPLCVGSYAVGERNAPQSDVPVQTFFSAGNQRLSPRYLEAAARHLDFYAGLHGSYAFEKFAVVENFFPTGYGFPSFTLLGGRVLRLPFIPETSLRHEVAHCWWGNGVLVDYHGGNWCEGLTAYVSDYMAKEEQSPAEALGYRLRTLRDYAMLVGGDESMPLATFVSRTSPASQAVGYDKCLFVFHMLRRQAGDERFWQALRDLYAGMLFRKADWGGILDRFVALDVMPAAAARQFIEQWVQRGDAPSLRLQDVAVEPADKGYRVEGALVQEGLAGKPAFMLRVPLALQCEGETVRDMLLMESAEVSFELSCGSRPESLEADPEADVFRLLWPEEIPATVNSLKGAEGLSVLVSGEGSEARFAIARRLAMGLSQPEAAILVEAELDDKALAALAQRDVLFVGVPHGEAAGALLPELPVGVELAEGGLGLDAWPQAAEGDTVFLAARDYAALRSVGLLASVQQGSASDEALAAAARKITHYGSYGLLVFKQGRNLLKHRWPAHSSPLRKELADKERS